MFKLFSKKLKVEEILSLDNNSIKKIKIGADKKYNKLPIFLNFPAKGILLFISIFIKTPLKIFIVK